MVEAPTSMPCPIAMLATPRQGPLYLCRSYVAMLLWQLASMRTLLAVIALVQILSGVGLVLSFGLFFPTHIPVNAALYVSTGAPVINLYVIGLVVGPQVVAQQRLSHSYDYVQSMPVPHAIAALAWYTVTLVLGLPAVIVTLVVAALHYPIHLTVSPMAVPAILLICATATLTGYAMAHAIAQPMITMILTQVINFFVIGFSPVCFPSAQLPDWLARINDVLPFAHMATVMHGALAPALAVDDGRSYLVLAAWTVATAAIAGLAVAKRG
jgi:ABC-2 type transport system permease protein